MIVTWEDLRTGNSDIYAQKVSGETGQALWSATGLIVRDAKGSVVQQNAELTPTNKGEIILVFEDARSGYFNIYAQKITKAGSLAWGKQGIPVAKVAANQVKPHLVPDGQGGAIIAWEDHRIEGRPLVRVQRLNSRGKKVWQSSLPLALVKARQTNPLISNEIKSGQDSVDYHQKQGAKIMKEFLDKNSFPKNISDKVYEIISEHETGNGKEQKILRDADRINYFENIAIRRSRASGMISPESIKNEFQRMLSDISSKKAKELAEPFYKKALHELNRK